MSGSFFIIMIFFDKKAAPLFQRISRLFIATVYLKLWLYFFFRNDISFLIIFTHYPLFNLGTLRNIRYRIGHLLRRYLLLRLLNLNQNRRLKNWL